MRETIEHQGVVESVVGEHVKVNILQVSACSGCRASALCSMSESKEKIIDVYEQEAARKYRPGDTVKVCGTLGMGKQAVRLAFGVPLLLTALWMLVAMAWLRLDELVAVGVLALLLTVYFCTLYIYRDKMAKRFAFWIE